MQLYWLMLGILAVWRITHLLGVENGPWNVFGYLRRQFATGFWSSLLGCFYCLSLWVAAPFTLLLTDAWRERLLLWPALSAGAILLQRLSTRAAAAPPAVYYEEEENPNVFVRKDDRVELGGSLDGRRN